MAYLSIVKTVDALRDATVECLYISEVFPVSEVNMETKQEPHCSTTDEHTALSPTDADAPTDTSAPTGASAPADDPAPSDSLAPPSARAHKKTSVQIVDLKELEDRGYTVVKVEEKHGPLHNAIPCMPLPLAIICCLFNIVTPGIGACW